MKALTLGEILRLDDWERVRPLLRPLFVREKDRRRLGVGAHITLLFENAQTVWYQIEEMIRVERMADDELVQHEVDTYNELLPKTGELSATLFVEYPNAAERDVALRQLVGLEQHLWLRAGERRVAATLDASQIGTEQVSAVQFVRFTLPTSSREEFLAYAASGTLAIEVDHPALAASAPIIGQLARALAEDAYELTPLA